MECVTVLDLIKERYTIDDHIQKRRDIKRAKLSDFWKIQYNRVLFYCKVNGFEIGGHEQM